MIKIVYIYNMYSYIEINDLQDEQFMLVSKLKQLGFLRTRFYDSLPTSVAKQKDWQLTFPCGVIPLPGHGIFLQGDTSSKRERRMGSLGQINHQQWYNGGFCSCRFGVGWGRPKGIWRLGFSSLVVFILNYGTICLAPKRWVSEKCLLWSDMYTVYMFPASGSARPPPPWYGPPTLPRTPYPAVLAVTL